jgi:predicted esterase
MKENHIIINKTARFYTLGELNEKTKSVWIVLHGFRQTAQNFLSLFEPLANEKTFFVAPEGLNRFYISGYSGAVGATWMTKEDRLNEIKDYINYLNDLYALFELEKFSGNITALGFSQGASTLTRWINATENRIDNTIVYAGEVAPDILPLHENSGLNRSKNFFVCGDKDEIFTAELISKIKESYSELKFSEISFHGKHELNTEVLKNFF